VPQWRWPGWCVESAAPPQSTPMLTTTAATSKANAVERDGIVADPATRRCGPRGVELLGTTI
ncbi:MAG TPA: hypothetical protein VE400_19645, partial [Mycobacterium sp.]|nr:hypothetical protein [Mycobacterium sp.]